MSTSLGPYKMGVTGGYEEDEDKGEGSSTPKGPAQMPRLIAPRPVYAAPRFAELTQIDSSRIDGYSGMLAANDKSEGQGRLAPPNQLENMQTSTSSSLRAMTDKEAILPVKGDDSEASEAVEKLERMTKALQNKRRLLRSTGVEGMVIAATAGGKQRARRVRGALREKKEGDDDEGGEW